MSKCQVYIYIYIYQLIKHFVNHTYFYFPINQGYLFKNILDLKNFIWYILLNF